MAFAEHLSLAKGLPPRLLRFFEKYPPQIPQRYASKAEPATSNAASSGSLAKTSDSTTGLHETAAAPFNLFNPFEPHKHPVTGKWHNPKYSLRQQADLVKLAKKYGLEELLPTTEKGTEEKLARREDGLRVKGTGVGQRVKGHWRERTMSSRLEKRRQAMLDMPKLIYQWKQLGHGRGWKKYPK